MVVKDEIKALPRSHKLNGVWVGIGGELKRKNGTKIKEATSKQYKELQKIFPGMFKESPQNSKPKEEN